MKSSSVAAPKSFSLQQVRHAFHYLRLFTRPLTFLFLLLATGIMGYLLLEDFTVFEGLYMTVITITTVGFGEIRPLSDGGRVFTICLILGGVLFYGLAINVIFQIIFERSFKGFMEAQMLKEKLKTISDHYIVCGGGRMALAICSELEKAGHDFIVIEKNQESPVYKHASDGQADWTILSGDALSEETLQQARLERAKGLFSVLPTDADNLFVVLSARRLNAAIWIETRIAHETTRPKMLQAGANRVLSPYHVAGVQMARSMIKPQVDDFIEIFLGESNFEFEVKVHRVSADDPAVEKPLSQSKFAENGFTVVGLLAPDGTMHYAPDSAMVTPAGSAVFLLGKGRR
ncbi:MAG: potassium channel family protein [Turneriella sp.]